MEEVDQFGGFVLDPPTASVHHEHVNKFHVSIVGDHIGRFGTPVIFHNDLAERLRTPLQSDIAFMSPKRLVFALGDRQFHFLPLGIGQRFGSLFQFLATPSQGDEQDKG